MVVGHGVTHCVYVEKKVNSIPSQKAHRSSLISVSLAFSQTPAYTARPRISEISRQLDHNLIPRRYISENYMPDALKNGNEELWNELKPVLVDPYFAPLMATKLDGLPVTYIATAEYDVLRDDGILYARSLSTAASVSCGVPVYFPAFAGIHCAYPRTDGQAESTWVAS